MRVALIFVLSASILGCTKAPQDQAVSLEQVPPLLTKLAGEKLPGVKFEQAIKRGDGTYEIRGRDKRGKVRDIDLTADGQIIEIE